MRPKYLLQKFKKGNGYAYERWLSDHWLESPSIRTGLIKSGETFQIREIVYDDGGTIDDYIPYDGEIEFQ